MNKAKFIGVPEHYHIGCDVKGVWREVRVAQDKSEWVIRDDWGDVSGEHKILGRFKTLDGALKGSVKVLRKAFPGCVFGDGAGFPANWQSYVGRK
jgi:hypothetical protein